MAEPIITVNNIGKKYILGKKSESGAIKGGFPTLRDRITDGANWLKNKTISTLSGKKIVKPTYKEFWALKDVSFEVHPGEIIGIVGRNGAGKSTLLKLLSRITEPTTGEIILNGRVASLLEVGTGFHPELSGRENIFLNGAILGMSRSEIKKKFDEIVAFSEVEKFLDTPVKRYSSGMYVRLAFAVAAHLEPDILVVDEVLAVGDIAFQKKCLGKMDEVAKQEGRTVLFVSHNMETVQSLCQKAYLLEAGKIKEVGAPPAVISAYLRSLESLMNTYQGKLAQREDRSGEGTSRIIAAKVEDADGRKVIQADSRLRITIDYQGKNKILHPQFSATIYDYNKGIGIISLHSEMTGGLAQVFPEKGRLICITEPINITPGRCYINLTLLKSGTVIDYLQHAIYFDVEASDFYGTGKLQDRDWVMCLRQHKWLLETTEKIDAKQAY